MPSRLRLILLVGTTVKTQIAEISRAGIGRARRVQIKLRIIAPVDGKLLDFSGGDIDAETI